MLHPPPAFCCPIYIVILNEMKNPDTSLVLYRFFTLSGMTKRNDKLKKTTIKKTE